MRTARKALASWAILALTLTAAACGDPPLASKTADAGIDALGGLDSAAGVDVQGSDLTPTKDAAFADQPGDSAPLDTAADTPQPPDAANDTQTDATADSGADSKGDGAVLDTAVAEFALLSADPTDGASNIAQDAVLTWTFSAPVKAESAVAYTIAVSGPGGDSIAGKFSVAGATVTFAPKAPLPLASRIDIALGTLVQSKQGAPLTETKLRFYTRAAGDLQKYDQLAARFAPTIRQAVGHPDDYLRALDFDGDWNAWDNPSDTKAFYAQAEVTWAAVETRSHLYLTYTFYWPTRLPVAPGVGFDNDVAGAQVVVERSSGLPVALQTFFKAKSDEQAWLWLVSEAGFPTKSKYYRGILPRDQLFPPADPQAPACQPGSASETGCPRRYPAYLTAGHHQSCLWIDKGESGDGQCVLSDYLKSQLKTVIYAPGLLAQEPGLPSASGTPATYTLRPLLSSWWPHRDEAGDKGLFADTQFVYVPASARPPGPKYGLGSRLASSQDGDFGRPPWAWRWKPGTFSSSYYDLPRGLPLFDPAHLLYQRLGGDAAGPATWNATAKSGFSQDYCFNPYLGIDQRQTPECAW
jgi:hypothetical protein